MNTVESFHSRPTHRPVLAAGFLLGSFILASVPLVPGAETLAASASAPADRSYVIFAGLDVFVDDHGTRRPVVGGSENEVVVWDERREAAISMRDVALSAAVEPRLTSASVTLAVQKAYPVYSPGKDPAAAAQAQQFFLLNLEGARAEESEQNARAAQAVADSFGSIAPSVGSDSPGAAAYQAQMDEAGKQASAAMADMASTYANPIYRDSSIGSPGVDEDFDGFAVAFVVSAPQSLSDAYGVLRLRLRATGQPGAPVMNTMKMFRLRKLDAKPRKVVVRQFGLPPGFTMDSYQIHVYADGHELATNTSPNRVEVTEDEAHQFLILRHLQRNPGATLPAQLAREFLDDAPAAARVAALKNAAVDVSVTADGRVAEVNLAAISPDQPGAELEETLRRVRFLPALLHGKPAESKGTFAMSEFFRQP